MNSRIPKILAALRREAEDCEQIARQYADVNRTAMLSRASFLQSLAMQLEQYVASHPIKDIAWTQYEPLAASGDARPTPSKVAPAPKTNDFRKEELEAVGYVYMQALIMKYDYEMTRLILLKRLHCTMGRATDLIEHWEKTTNNKLPR